MSGTGARLSLDELQAEGAVALPTKEVLSLLDLDANIDLALALAAPIDLAVAANLNIAAPIDAAVSANVLSTGSESIAAAPQQTLIDQFQSGSAIANAPQDAVVDQTDEVDAPAPVPTPEPVPAPTDGELTVGNLLDGPLLDVDVVVDADLDIAAPIAGAVAANANIAAPIDAAVSANLLSVDSSSTAVASQTAVITQSLEGVVAEANAEQTAAISQ